MHPCPTPRSCFFCHNAGTTMLTRRGRHACRAGTSSGRVGVGLMGFARGQRSWYCQANTHDNNSTRGQDTSVASMCMHRTMLAHSTPHTRMQAKRGRHSRSGYRALCWRRRDSSDLLEGRGCGVVQVSRLWCCATARLYYVLRCPIDTCPPAPRPPPDCLPPPRSSSALYATRTCLK